MKQVTIIKLIKIVYIFTCLSVCMNEIEIIVMNSTHILDLYMFKWGFLYDKFVSLLNNYNYTSCI